MKYILTLLAALWVSTSLSAQIAFEREETSTGQIGLAISNYGTLGKPDVRNNPQSGSSMRYPISSGMEHLFEAGIWIGIPTGGGRVSTSAITNSSGYARGKAGFEFTADREIQFQGDNTGIGVSQQDIIVDFTDRRQDVGGQEIANHIPIYVDVHMESYNWDFPFTENFTILRYDFTNNSQIYDVAETWDSVYVGMYADLVVRNVNAPNIETGSDFFNKNGLGYLDSLYTTYVFDAGSADNPSINTYGAMSLIGADYRNEFFHPSNPDTTGSRFSSSGYNVPDVGPSYWLFSQGTGQFQGPGDDIERYRKMAETFPIDGTLPNGTPYRQALREDGQDSEGNYISFISIGPFPEVAPGETFTVYFALSAAQKPEEFQGVSNKEFDTEETRVNLENTIRSINRVFQGEDTNNNGVLDAGEDSDENGELTRYLFPTPPDNPNVRIELQEGKAVIYWDRISEQSVDRVSKEMDFEGYRIYSTDLGDDLNPTPRLIREFDTPGNDIGFNTGFNEVALTSPITFEGDTVEYWYAYEIEGLLSGWQYQVSVTAFDGGSEEFEIGSLESSRNTNAVRVFPGTPVNENFSSSSQQYEVGVYPNPYRINAAWDGTGENNRKINFYNLPANAEIRIYTLAGEIVAELEHDAATYSGDIGWYNTFSDGERILPGGEHSWDLQSDANQLLTTGLYFYSVKDLNSGAVQTGKLVIIK